MITKFKFYGYGCILSITSLVGAFMMFYGITGKYHGSYLGSRFLSIGMILFGGAILLIFQLGGRFEQHKSAFSFEGYEQYKQIAPQFSNFQKKYLGQQ